MSFINAWELGRSAINNIKNNTWDVHPCYRVYEDDGKGIVAYTKMLEERIKELEERLNEN